MQLIVMNLFIFSCVFDPADTVLRLKIPLFILSWLIYIISRRSIASSKLPVELVTYVALMIGIPLVSVFYYMTTNGEQPYQGIALLKAYLLMSFAILLYWTKIDLLPALSKILTLLSIVIIGVYVGVLLEPSTIMPLYYFGESTGIFSISEREYSATLKLWSIYFVTSPMITVAIAFYMHRVFKSQKKIKFILLVSLNAFALFIAGTRNNMFTALLLPVVMIIMYSRYKFTIIVVAACSLMVFTAIFIEPISAMLNPAEKSNEVKIKLLSDYERIFADVPTVLLGQGLGAYYNWTDRGSNFETEQTYLEILRNYGIFMGGVVIALMIYPILYAYYLKKGYRQKYLIVAYGFYLLMTATNPLFFSSLGILILSVVIANIFIYRYSTNLLLE